MTDRTVQCAMCQRDFVISPSERIFYAERGYQEPTECPECRAKRRANRQTELLSVSAQPTAGLRLGTYGGFAPAGPRAADGNGRYTAKCSSCGGEAVVPFEPRPGRPVYCRRCYGARKSH